MTVTLWTNATVATMGCGTDEYGLVPDGAVAWEGETILAVGSPDEVRTAIGSRDDDAGAGAEEIDLDGRLVTPGLIDCHTHLVFAGSRAAEFEQRIAGATYAEIAAAGGGIRTTMTATRAATEDELVAAALPRLDALVGDGVTTVEVKSGYGLDLDTELRLLRAAHRLATERRVEVVPTLLAAHTVPPEFAGRADDFVAVVCDTIIPAVAASGLAGAVDVFCESIAFDLEQTRRVAAAAAAHGLAIKGHTEQLSALGGGPMLAAAGALSIDHGEHLSDRDVAVIAEHGTVVVLLPGACYFTGERQHPPVGAMRAAGVPMAVATDTNPGTSPLASLRLAANQACVTFGLTVPEAMHGITSVAARALGLHDRGRITAGARADLVAWDVDHPAELVYEPVTPRQYRRIVAGSASAREKGSTWPHLAPNE